MIWTLDYLPIFPSLSLSVCFLCSREQTFFFLFFPFWNLSRARVSFRRFFLLKEHHGQEDSLFYLASGHIHSYRTLHVWLSLNQYGSVPSFLVGAVRVLSYLDSVSGTFSQMQTHEFSMNRKVWLS